MVRIHPPQLDSTFSLSFEGLARCKQRALFNAEDPGKPPRARANEVSRNRRGTIGKDG